MKKYFLIPAAILICSIISGQQVQKVNINIMSGTPSGLIDSKIYGQLFEHIYFSADGGLWGEMLAERSFEPEQYPGISPRAGFFDGWYSDDDNILHSPTLFEQPIPLVTVDAGSYIISTDIKWRAYKFARHMWSGGYADMSVEFKSMSDGKSYRFRVHDPQYEGVNPRNPQPQKQATFAIERETTAERQGRDGKPMTVTVWEPVVSAAVKPGQIDGAGVWHNLRISCSGKNVKVFWDGKQVLKYMDLENISDKEQYSFRRQ